MADPNAKTRIDAPLLSSNDLAAAVMAVGLALAWHRQQPMTRFRRKEEAKLKALLTKLDCAADHLNPYTDSDDMPPDWGDDPIYGPLTTSRARTSRRSTHPGRAAGGHALAAKMTPEQRTGRAQRAAAARWGNRHAN